MDVKSGVILIREIAAPSAPASGFNVMYTKTDDLMYMKSSAGVERLVAHAIEPYVMSRAGVLSVAAGTGRLYLSGAYAYDSLEVGVNTAPTGAALLVDVNKNGTTIFTTQGNRPSIAISGFRATIVAPDVTTFAAGDYVTVDVDQIGSTIPGSDLTIVLRLRRTS